MKSQTWQTELVQSLNGPPSTTNYDQLRSDNGIHDQWKLSTTMCESSKCSVANLDEARSFELRRLSQVAYSIITGI
jgi:hypothetical protein